MSDLKRRYRKALKSRIEALERALGELDSDSSEAEQAIRRIAHSLTGSGGSYGFPEVSEAASGIEDAKREALPSRVEDLLEVLRETASGTGEERGSEILVVEDDPEMAHLLKHILDDDDREVLVASSGWEAQRVLAGRVPDLVLLDLILPDADGRNILMQIRERPATATIPVIIISGKTSAMARSECFALGADDFLVKPFNPQEVHDTVAKYLERDGPLGHQAPDVVAAADVADPELVVKGFEALQARPRRFSLMLLRIQLLDLGEGSDEAGARAELTESITSVIGPHLLEEDVLSRWSPQELVLLLVGTGGGRAAEIMAHLGEAVQSGALAESIPGLEFEILSGVSPVAEGETLQQAFSGARARLSSSAMTSERTRRAEEEVESEHAPILLAEDDDLTASLIEHRLGRAGYEVAHFTDGRKAWEAASEGGFSLVILDVKLPGMEGFEILEKIRSNSASADIPVILLTAMGREEDVVRGFGLGADDYVLKPFSPVELIARAQRLLRGPQKASSSTAEPRPPLDQDGI